jgi:hypothetical protein
LIGVGYVKAFYTSFLIRIKWDREKKILGGEIQQAQGTQQEEPAKGFFRGLDIERITRFIEGHLDAPGFGLKTRSDSDEVQAKRNGDSRTERD